MAAKGIYFLCLAQTVICELAHTAGHALFMVTKVMPSEMRSLVKLHYFLA
jgi:hypothetical protein